MRRNGCSYESKQTPAPNLKLVDREADVRGASTVPTRHKIVDRRISPPSPINRGLGNICCSGEGAQQQVGLISGQPGKTGWGCGGCVGAVQNSNQGTTDTRHVRTHTTSTSWTTASRKAMSVEHFQKGETRRVKITAKVGGASWLTGSSWHLVP